jgi:hypothetical protein
VFKNGSTPIAKKLDTYNNDIEEYICKNQLETTMQKAFFVKIKKALHEKALINEIFIQVFETRGNGGLFFTVYKNVEKGYCISFQLQANTLKIDLQELRNGLIVNYLESKYSNIAKFEKEFITKFKIDGRRFNPPKNSNRRNEPLGRYSVSHKLEKPIFELNIADIIEIIEIEVKLILAKEY